MNLRAKREVVHRLFFKPDLAVKASENIESLPGRMELKVLESIGFLEHRQKSTSHLVMKHNDGGRTIVPMHSNKDIPKGTRLAIIKDIQITY